MAKIVKNNWAHFAIILVVFLIATGWIFSGFPRIWQNPPFPPEVQEAQAAAVPTVRSVGTVGNAQSAISPGLPSGVVAGDLLIMFVENSGEAEQTASGWTKLDSQSTTGTWLTVLYKIAVGSDATTTNDVGDHQVGRIIAITKDTFSAAAPFGAGTIVKGTQTSGTSKTIGAMITTIDNALVIAAIAGDLPDGNGEANWASWTNTNLSNLIEQIDNSKNSGNGGSLGVETGGKASAGSTGNTTVTAASNRVTAHMMFAVKPAPPIDSDSAVEIHGGGAQSSFALNPLNDTAGAKFSVLKFQIRDTATTDALPTLIDRITIAITGTGGNASTDIAWAELWDDTGNAQVATAASIANSLITFGSTPDAGGTAALDTVASAGTIRYTVNVYMKSSALTATDGQTYIFGINDSNVGTDTSLSSSQMRSNAGAVTNVTGTITVASSKLTFTTQPPASATTDTDFAGTIGVSATDEHINIDKDFTTNIILSAVLSSDNGIPGTGTLSSTDSGGLEKTPTNGTATWTDTRYTYAETIDIKATSSSYTEYSTAVTITTISLVQQATNIHTYGEPHSSITATLSSAAANNLLVTVIATDKSAGTYYAPAGFTPIHDYIGPSVSSAMAYKIADGGETAITWSYAASEESSIWVGEYAGLASSNVFDVAAEADSADVTVTSQTTGTTAATAQANELAVAMFGIDSGTNATGRSWTNSFTEVSFLGTGSSTAGLGVATKILSSTGTQTTTASWSLTDQACGIIATFKTPSAAATISSAANQTFTVNQSATGISTITITDHATTATITNADDIRIKIPSSFNMTWATSDTAANIGGTDWDHTGAASQGAEVTVTYEDSDKTLVVPVTADFQAGDDITVYGLSFANFSAGSSADNLELETADNGSTVDYDDKTKTVVAPTISSAANQSFTVGQSATAISTITITDNATTPTITATNDIRIKIPATFNMTWATSDTAANIGGTDWDHTGAASQGAEVTVTFEDSDKTVVVPVTADFETGDDITVYGLSFANFTAASSADNLELETDNAGTTAAYDDKTKTITSLTISFQDGVYPTSGYSDTRDTVIKQQAATADYGIQAFIDIDGDDPSSTGYDNWGILKWDVSSISAGSTVQSATITINITDLSPSAYNIYEMKKNWVEGNGAAGSGANWNTYNGTNTWETAGAQGTTDRGTTSFGASPTSVTGSQTITLNASGIAKVQGWINSPSTNYGIIWGDLAFTDGLDFTSREGTTASQRPKLTITYIPGTATISSAANQSFTIGDSATGISTITITDNATAATITNADDIRIKIPSSFNMTWATSDTAANIGGTDWDHTGAATQDAEVTVTFEDSDKTLVVPVTADFETGDDITVYGLSFANFTAASSADNLELETDNAGTTADTDDKTITVVANETIVSKQNNAPSSVSNGSTVNSLGTFKFDGSGTISQIILTEYGTCDADDDLQNIKLFQDDGDGTWEVGQDTTQLGSTVTAFNASDNATFSDFSLSAGGTTYVHVILNVESTATEGQTIGIEIYQASRVTSTKTVTASSWPVQLGTSNITGPSYTILFHADNRPGNAADGMAQLTADFNQADNQMEAGWTLTAVQNAGDVDPVTSAGGSQNEDGAYNASELKTVYDLPHFFAVGNHEAETTQDMTDIRAKYSGYPAWNLQAGPTGTSETTYSYDVGEMHIAVINEYWDGASDDHSGIGYIHNNLFTWLKNDLRASTKPYKMVVGHEPGYPLDRHVGDALDADTNNRNKFFNLLRTERVIAYMTGHDHNYHSPEYDGVFEVDPGVTGCMLEGGGAGQNDNFATLGYAHYDPTNGFKIRMAREDPTSGWSSPWVASVTRSDLRTQVLANTAEGAGTYWNGVDTDKKTKYFIDYTAADQTNPDWSGNNSSKWWENAFDDATASWTAGEPSIGYDQTTPASWINTSISKLNGVYGVFQRIRFKAYDKSSYNAIRLGVDYDDAITVWLNGTEIYKSSESPTVAAGDIWDKTASAAHAAAGEGGLNPSFTWIDVSQYLNNLNEGDNVLAIGNWNQAATSDDLMAGVKLILEDSIFIMESGNNRLMKRNQGDLTYRAKIGSVGAGDDQFNTPYGITSDSDYLWIADYTNNRIVKRQKNDNLTYSSQFNQFGSDTVFSGPKDIAVDGSYIYVVDAGNHRLVRGNKTNLAFVDQFGVTGVASPDNSHFNDPNGVYVDDDYVYVSDKVNHRVVKLNKSNLSYVSQAGETGVSGTDNSHFNEPYGIAGDDTYLYLSEASGHRLNKRLKSDLSYVTKSGTFGTGDDQFSTPRHIDIDNTYIYVIDGGNSRVKKHYQSDLSYVSKIGTAGAGDDQFNTPRGITIDHSTAGVSITVNDGEIDYGVIELGGSKSTLDVSETQVATNSGIGALDFNIRGYNALAWTLDTTSSSNHYVHEFATDGGTVWTALTLNYQSLATNVAQDATVDFDLRLTIPTETSSTSQDVYVTVQAVPP